MPSSFGVLTLLSFSSFFSLSVFGLAVFLIFLFFSIYYFFSTRKRRTSSVVAHTASDLHALHASQRTPAHARVAARQEAQPRRDTWEVGASSPPWFTALVLCLRASKARLDRPRITCSISVPDVAPRKPPAPIADPRAPVLLASPPRPHASPCLP
ncbi:hypothetical protein DFH11DRAFT_257248 [Phellopilus nigrolimitatus]|nr:hypothetical protein DFH11DRAFT_257248 [Phellopilus nigrolimitatus]